MRSLFTYTMRTSTLLVGALGVASGAYQPHAPRYANNQYRLVGRSPMPVLQLADGPVGDPTDALIQKLRASVSACNHEEGEEFPLLIAVLTPVPLLAYHSFRRHRMIFQRCWRRTSSPLTRGSSCGLPNLSARGQTASLALVTLMLSA